VMDVPYGSQLLTLEIPHAGGANLELGEDAYFTLLEWLNAGATENGVAPSTPADPGSGACSTALPPGFDPSPYTGHAQFATFRDQVQPIFEEKNCSSGNCHGAPQADFYITCGDDDDQIAFNFAQAWAFVDDPVAESQLLQVPLAVAAGGLAHTGGDQFESRSDGDYVTIEDWAAEVGAIVFGEGDPRRQFFADNVIPVLIKRGCLFTGCHSPAASNDFKLRQGSQGFFSAVALEKNYELMKHEFMAMEMPDAGRGRAVAKGIFADVGGIEHRGGEVLETPGAPNPQPELCPPVFDPATASAFCVIQEWVDLERAAMLTAGTVLPLGDGDTVPIVYVDRAVTHVATPLEFDTYQPGSDLLVAQATIGPGGFITTVGAGVSLLDNCAGAASRATVDVRAPDVRFDGNRVAFAMRTSSGDPLGVWAVDLTGTNCVRLTPAAGSEHNFDPAWSPDGEWIVFASSRGGGVSRMLFLPQSDLWRMRSDGTGLEQMTFLSNSEISPQFMREGRVTMTTEKVSADFYQLSGRRINWDLTDYHPLLGQRASSPYADLGDISVENPSIDYGQVTDIREDANGNFLIILSDAGARGGAGTLATFNRSVGPMEVGRTDDGYLPSMIILDPAATGRVGSATSGAYRNPVGLPGDEIMVSYTGFSGDLGTATSLDWDIVAVNADTGARTTLIGGAGAQVDAVLALKYEPREMYYNRRQLVFGGNTDDSLGGDAIVHMPDAPMLFTLLTGNLRRGRPVDAFRDAAELVVYSEGGAPDGTSSGNQDDGRYEQRAEIGRAALRGDGSVKVRVPAGRGIVFELRDGNGNIVVTMGEEHQLGPNEQISMGVIERLFDAVCAGCHGSVSSSELDVSVTPDALTGASQSLSAGEAATNLAN
jgi:hypothetical protein